MVYEEVLTTDTCFSKWVSKKPGEYSGLCPKAETPDVPSREAPAQDAPKVDPGKDPLCYPPAVNKPLKKVTFPPHEMPTPKKL